MASTITAVTDMHMLTGLQIGSSYG